MALTEENIDAASLLKWHVAMGADDAIDHEPVDRFLEIPPAETTAAAVTVSNAEHTPPTRNTAVENPGAKNPASHTTQNTSTSSAVKAIASGPTPVAARPAQPTSGAGPDLAEKAAAACSSISELKTALENFDGGLLKRSAKNTVFAGGTEGAPLMVIGDVPSREDDQNGQPFSGPSGQLLDKMLAAIGMSRAENVYLSTVLPWRPLGNSKPDASLLAVCKPFTARHIELAQPKLVLGLGGALSKALFETQDSISRQRGRWQSFMVEGQNIALIATYHPSYLLSQPHMKAAAWQDLLSVKEKMSS